MTGWQGQIDLFLQNAVWLCDEVADIHQAGRVHGELTMSSLTFSDDGRSVLLEHPSASRQQGDQFVLSRLPYLAPEQTGRLSLPIDQRTDIYSMGIIFYEMLSGVPPFTGSDSLALIAAHLNEEPADLHVLDRAVPRPIAMIISLMLAKEPGLRYCSVARLKHDLSSYRAYLAKGGDEQTYSLADSAATGSVKDHPAPVGRRREVDLIISSWRKVAEGKKGLLVRIPGAAGTGKTSLVNYARQFFRSPSPIWASGQFEQFHADTPYGALAGMVNVLIRDLLGGDKDVLVEKRTRILDILGENAGIFCHIFPDLSLIIGSNVKDVQLSSEIMRQELHRLFPNFIQVFADAEAPLTLFFDDAQWADPASIQLIRVLVGNLETIRLLLLIAYRSDEMPDESAVMFNKMEGSSPPEMETVVELSNLDRDTTGKLISRLIDDSGDYPEQLPELVFEVSHGNPFHAIQFVRLLLEKRDLLQEDGAGKWIWRADQAGISDSSGLVDVLTGRLENLESGPRRTLTLASCFGSCFTVEDLKILPTYCDDLEANLAVLLSLNLIVRVQEGGYGFFHDKIRQAAYSLLDDPPVVHYGIGLRLLIAFDIDQENPRIFLMADHLNMARELIDDQAMERKLHLLNYHAGKRAIAAAAFESSYSYLSMSFDLMAEGCWQDDYRISLDLCNCLAEMAYICGHEFRMDQAVVAVMANGRTAVDKAGAHEVQIKFFNGRGMSGRALGHARTALRDYGLYLPSKPGNIAVMRFFFSSFLPFYLLKGHALADLPKMKDPKKLAVVRILSAAGLAAYVLSSNLFPIIVFLITGLSLRYGRSPHSPYAFAAMGFILTSAMGLVGQGVRFGRAASAVLHKEGRNRLTLRTNFIVNVFLRQWSESLRDIIPSLRSDSQDGVATGDPEFMAWSICNESFFLLISGHNLIKVNRHISQGRERVIALKQEAALEILMILQRFCLDLAGIGESGDSCEENFPVEGDVADALSVLTRFDYHNTGAWHACLFLDWPKAMAHGQNAYAHRQRVMGHPSLNRYWFFYGLSLVRQFKALGGRDRLRARAMIRRCMKKLGILANHAPDNYGHYWYLLEAERAGSRGNFTRADKYYRQAIKHASSRHLIHVEGFACELAALFRINSANGSGALELLLRAHECFSRWGATAKVRAMERDYASYFAPLAKFRSDSELVSMDHLAVIRATRLITEQYGVEDLLSTGITVLQDVAGADGTCLFFKNLVGDIDFEVEYDQSMTAPLVRNDPSPGGSDMVAGAVLNYVMQTGQAVDMDDAGKGGLFHDEPLIIKRKVRSMVCLPIVLENVCVGAAYLESRRFEGVFKAKTLELLNHLIVQIGISLVNALVISELREENKQRKAAELSGRESWENYRLLAENIRDVIWLVDLNGEIKYLSPSVMQLTGVSPEDGVGRKFADFIAPGSLPQAEELFRQGMAKAEIGGSRTSEPLAIDLEISRADGSGIWTENRVNFVRDGNGGIKSIIGVSRDIAMRRQFEDDLRKSRQELQDYSRHIREEREEERTEIARNIHDELGQSLTVMNLDLAWLTRHMDAPHEEVLAKVEQMQQQNRTASRQLKRISTELRPSVLEHFGLEAAFKWQVDEFRKQTGISTKLECSGEFSHLTDKSSLSFFRILQESLTNIIKHSRATELSIFLGEDDGIISLIIRDNGCGFNPSEGRRPMSYGILGMTERVQSMAGDFAIESAPDQGTTIKLTVPVDDGSGQGGVEAP